MKKTSGWFSSWSRANFEMGVSLHSTVFPLDPNTRPSNAWRFTPWWSLGSSECREWALGARNCRWCSGDPPRSRHIRCAFKILNHGFLKENHLGLVEDSYHSIPMFNFQRFGIHGWRVWMPCPISVQFLTMFLDGSRPAMWSHDAAWDIQKHATGKIKSDDHSQFYMGYIHWLMYGMWIIQ
jgi:hypothetical protein